MRKKRFFGLLLLVLLLLLAACGKETEPEANPNEGTYNVYYQDSSYAAVTQVVQIEATETEDIAMELFRKMKEPEEGVAGVSVLPEKVELTRVSHGIQVLYLFFNSDYQNMNRTQAVICRAALARTMTQIPGVEYIYIYAGNQPLMDEDGSPIGNLSASDFVSVTGKDVNTIQHTTLTLYFANQTGDKLVGEEVEVTYSNTASVEEFIIERLISGPEDTENMLEVLPKETQLLSISVRDGICYVNFSSELLIGGCPVSPDMSIYAVVNSLTTLSYITQVQITVEGSTDLDFGGISYTEPFFRNLDYILNEEEGE